jgi:hypothetical protein
MSLVAAKPVFADAALDEAIVKAVTERAQTKKVKAYDGHEFNIKPVTVIRRPGERYLVRGQLSHHLRLRKDDQYHYEIVIDGVGTVRRFDETINRGGITSTVLQLRVGDHLRQKISGPPAPGSRFRLPPNVTRALIATAGHWFGRKLDGSWEGAARKVALQIAAQVTGSRIIKIPRERPTTPRPPVRDHRTNTSQS